MQESVEGRSFLNQGTNFLESSTESSARCRGRLLCVQECEVCQKNKYQALSPAGLLQPLPIPSQTWSDISTDFIGGLPKEMGVDTILVVVDRLTKYAHFIASAHPYTTKDVAEVFLKEVVRLHGFLATIVTDRN